MSAASASDIINKTEQEYEKRCKREFERMKLLVAAVNDCTDEEERKKTKFVKCDDLRNEKSVSEKKVKECQSQVAKFERYGLHSLLRAVFWTGP